MRTEAGSYSTLMRELFDSRIFGPQPRDRGLSDFRRHLEWMRRHQWPARIAIIIGEIAIVYVILVFELLIGIGIAPWLG
jgi:hypothetical protein